MEDKESAQSHTASRSSRPGPQASHLALPPPRSANTEAHGPSINWNPANTPKTPRAGILTPAKWEMLAFTRKSFILQVFRLDCFLVLIKSTHLK